MSHKQSNLEQIPQRNKDLTFGYFRENDKQNKLLTPDVIKYLCLIYVNQNKDKFDPKNTNDMIKINDANNSITNDVNAIGKVNSYLENNVKTGVHIWTFQFQTDEERVYDSDGMIGIRRVETINKQLPKKQQNIKNKKEWQEVYDEIENMILTSDWNTLIARQITDRLEECFPNIDMREYKKLINESANELITGLSASGLIGDIDLQYGNDELVGYALKMDGTIRNQWGFGRIYAEKCNDGDIIEMKLDFTKLCLSFKMNNEEYGYAFGIARGEYKAGVCIDPFYISCFTLISYQKVYR